MLPKENDMDSESHIYGLLGRIHVLMRRTLNRITDCLLYTSDAADE